MIQTRDEGFTEHYCVYFAAYDPIKKFVFIGHHKKSGLWLFNGGHIDEGETPIQAVEREIGEEWGIEIPSAQIHDAGLQTTTIITNRLGCTTHYDIWYFVLTDKDNFQPDPDKLSTEFYEIGWKTITEAKALVAERNTLKAMELMEQFFRKS